MSKVPNNCKECFENDWCSSFYGGLGCYYEEELKGGNMKEEFKGITIEAEEDIVREPNHYKHGTFETIDEMLIVFGPQKTYDYCIMNSWKYRSRAPYKENFEQDMAKSNYYLELAKQIADKNEHLFFGGVVKLIKSMGVEYEKNI